MLKAKRGGYTNHQWAVVPCGLYCKARDYLLGADGLAELHWGTDNIAHTPIHMADKAWCDFEAFAEAFEAALGIHQLMRRLIFRRRLRGPEGGSRTIGFTINSRMRFTR